MSKSNLGAIATACCDAMEKYGRLEDMPIDALRKVRAFIVEHLAVTTKANVRKLAEVDVLIRMRSLRGIDVPLAVLDDVEDAFNWRAHSKQFAKGETPPVTIESLQAAWARDQEVMDDQRKEIAALKQTVNQLRQAAEKKHETVRRMAANVAEYMANVDKMQVTMAAIKGELEKRLAEATHRRGGRL